MIESVESGRDIPKYGDGNFSQRALELLYLSGRDIPKYGDGNLPFCPARSFKSPEGTSPGMGTETK